MGKNVIRIASFVFFTLILYSCLHHSKYYNLGDGFRYGYFDSKVFLNVYYNDQGIVEHGICYSVEWNEKFILVHYYPDNGSPNVNEDKVCLIDKTRYSLSPDQMKSTGIITDMDSINIILKNSILFNKKAIKYP